MYIPRVRFSWLLLEEILRRSKQSESGVVIYVDPSNSDIGPFEAVPVDVYVFADTWGIYIDELDIDITGLPRFALAVCVQVVESPISLSIFVGASTKSHVLKCAGRPCSTRQISHRAKIENKNGSSASDVVDWKRVSTWRYAGVKLMYFEPGSLRSWYALVPYI